jgi:hypothetical protein
VLDPTICADGFALTRSYLEKVNHYGLEEVKARATKLISGISGDAGGAFEVHGIALNWRGAWYEKSY